MEESMEESIVERLEMEINNITFPKALEIQLKLYDFIMPILCTTIILVNLLVVLSSGLILHKRQQPRSTYIFLGNVALSDLLIGCATLFGQYYPHSLRNEMICCISIGMTVCATLVSVLSIGLIGIDRYLYILNGIHYQRYVTSQRARIVVVASWIVAVVIAFLPAFGLRNPTDNGRLCWFIVLVPKEIVLLTTSIGMIPLGIVVILYSIILKRALSRMSYLRRGTEGTQVGALRLFRGRINSPRTSIASTQVEEANNSESTGEAKGANRHFIFSCCRKANKKNTPSIYSENKWRAIKVVLFTAGAFFVTWFPYFLASTLYVMCNSESNPDYCDGLRVAIASPLAMLGLSNSLMNPIIYAWWHNGFRESVKRIYGSLFSTRFTTTSTTQNTTHKSSQNSNSTALSCRSESSDPGNKCSCPPNPLIRQRSINEIMENIVGNEM